ncbi:MAG: hypothetical protein WBM76_12705, partial [Woeseiaceae bacterium]
VIDSDNTLHIRNVEAVRADAEFTYFRGAVDGERIVISALEAPIDGMRVRTTADEAAEAASTVATADGEEGE